MPPLKTDNLPGPREPTSKSPVVFQVAPLPPTVAVDGPTGSQMSPLALFTTAPSNTDNVPSPRRKLCVSVHRVSLPLSNAELAGPDCPMTPSLLDNFAPSAIDNVPLPAAPTSRELA